MPKEWLSAEEAAKRLGVKQETLYAYVSRGLVRSERTKGERRSRYLRADIKRLAARQRGGGRAAGLDLIIDSEITHIDPAGRLSYRGWRIEDIARDSMFEQTARWLWTGTPEPAVFASPHGFADVSRRAIRAMNEAATTDQIRAALVAMRTVDPLRDDRRPVAVAGVGEAIIGTLLDTLPCVGEQASGNPSAARRLWPILTAATPTAKAVDVLDTALILLADHELAASTLAARVAASTWADPYLVVQAGLAALGGPLHGGASEAARQLLREVRDGVATVDEVLGSHLRTGTGVPGFGHTVYTAGDPRATVLLNALTTRSPTTATARRVLDATAQRQLPAANIDFAMSVLAETYDMVPDATETIFAIARITGWLAHAAEEYKHQLRFRPRAVYTGPPEAVTANV